MSEIDNSEIKTILYDISKKIILPKFKNLQESDIKFKNGKDIVTVVDVSVEKKLKNILLRLLPNSLFVGEESFFRDPNIIKNYLESKFCWTVDPIDGTNNFVKGEDKFAIMIGLTFKEKIIQSWIFKPVSGDFCYAKLENGAFINNKKNYNLKKTNIQNSIGSISSKYWDNKYINIIKEIKNKFKQINSYGCIGFEYIDIARGIRDFAILSNLSPWDHIPGILFIKESGGTLLHFDKLQYNHTIKKDNLVVANSNELQREIIDLINKE